MGLAEHEFVYTNLNLLVTSLKQDMDIITLTMYEIIHEKYFLIKQKEAVKREFKTYKQIKESSDVHHRFTNYIKYLDDQLENNAISMKNELLSLPQFGNLMDTQQSPLHKKQKTSHTQLPHALGYRQSKITVGWESLTNYEIHCINQLTHIDEKYGVYWWSERI
jgi:hypothetical protein